MNTKRFFQLFYVLVLVMVAVPLQTVSAQTCSPTIGIQFTINETLVRADCFEPDSNITLSIFDTSTPPNTIYTESSSTPPFLLSTSLKLEPGYVIKASDGISTKQLTIESLAIDKVDTYYDEVFGTTSPYTSIYVFARLPDGTQVGRYAFSDATGKWYAEFGYDNSGQGKIIDIQNGILIGIFQQDADYDIQYREELVLPKIEVDLQRSVIKTSGWGGGTDITLTVDDPFTTLQPDFTYTKTVWSDYLNLTKSQIGYSINVGNTITVEGNGVSSTYTIKQLQITRVDSSNDIIQGISEPNQTIYLDFWYGIENIKSETSSNEDGDWVLDFKTFVPPVDLAIGNDYGYITVYDEYGNSTKATLTLYEPRISVNLYNNKIQGNSFQLGDLVKLTVDNPETSTNPDFLSSTISDGNPIQVTLDPSLPIKTGHIIKMFDSVSTRELVVWDLHITLVDMTNDIVYGYTDLKNESVEIQVSGSSSYASRFVYSDSNGFFSANFSDPGPWNYESTADIQLGTWITLSQNDVDYDFLFYHFVVPANFSPIANAGGPYSSSEGTTVTLNASLSSDPDGDPLTYEWDLDNDGEYDDATGITAQTSYVDNGNYAVGLQVTDSGGLSDTTTTTIYVYNVAPQIQSVTGFANAIPAGSEVSLEVTFTDQGILDTHTVTWNWGDGSKPPVTPTPEPTEPPTETPEPWAFPLSTPEPEATPPPKEALTTIGTHAYTAPGVYTVSVTVTDDDGGSATASYQYIVVYDPNGGFVSGNGTIISPEGAYESDPTLTGKAVFGFVSKYLKGANIPEGDTQFQFKVADLKFKSTSYDWLVVAGNKAKFKGTGTINGEGEYGFMLSAIDGEPDMFRIKIWNKATGEVIYDNQTGASDDGDAATTLESGSIVIHK